MHVTDVRKLSNNPEACLCSEKHECQHIW